MTDHPFIKYAEALVRVNHGLELKDDITKSHLVGEIENGLRCFKLFTPSFEGKEQVKYQYYGQRDGDTSNGYFLAPNIIAHEQRSKDIWKAGQSLLGEITRKSLDAFVEVTMSIAPMAGEYLRFSESNAGRGKAKIPLRDIALCAISSTTPLKPCLQYTTFQNSGSSRDNSCIIPDLSVEELMDFIVIYKRIMKSRLSSDLLIGRVKKIEKKKNHVTYQPLRPLIFHGNFPNPPRSSALGSVGLLAAIGQVAKEAEVSNLANRVLESLKGVSMYQIKYGDASTFFYNHHIVDLARDGNLRKIVDGVYYSELYNEGWRSKKNSTEYQKFDLFTSRFLQLFTKSAFRDFLSFRAEYPNALNMLFNTYFNKIEMIDPKIVSSARELGRWLNQVAYFAAKNEMQPGIQGYWDELRKAKSKILVSLESSAFSAKTGDALIFQVVTQAGRISGMDAPETATLFMERTSSGELSLDNAKHLLIAFSRVKNKVEQKEVSKDNLLGVDDPSDDTEDLSNE